MAMLLWTHAALARAAPPFELGWEAPPQCPDAAAARAQITALLHDAPDDAHARFVRAEVTIEASGPDYRVTLTTEPDAAARILTGNDCVELATTAALIVAIAVDPHLLARVDHEAPADASAPAGEVMVPELAEGPGPSIPVASQRAIEPARRPVTSATASDNAAAPVRARPRVVGRVVAGLDAGTVALPTAELAASVGLAWRRASVELEGAYAVRRVVRSPVNDAVGVRVQGGSVGMRGCGVLHRGRIALPMCGVARGGLVHARGDGALQPHAIARQPWIGAGPGVMLRVAVAPRLALVFGIDALVALLRGGFRSEPSGRITAPWSVALHAWAGVQWGGVLERGRGGQAGR